MAEPLAPGGTIGILGGGQLGRMLAMAAARLGYRVHVYAPPGEAPAAELAADRTAAGFDDAEALAAFAAACDVVTFEFENVPLAALDAIAPHAPVLPPRRALAVAQDRLAEKTFLTGLGLATAAFAAVDDAPSLATALDVTGTPAILKTRRLGYDGKGQARIDTPAQADAALAALAGAPAIAEARVEFTAEISVIAARSQDGAVAAYDPGLNLHRDGILATTTVPAAIPASVATDAVLIAGRILNALDYTGVIGVELFVTRGGLVVNEIAPRVHNSGHWTEAGCVVDQFEQHVRAIAGLPLGDGARLADVTMRNMIGGDVADAAAAAADPAARVHLYGKAQARPGRKMGHVNHVAPRRA